MKPPEATDTTTRPNADAQAIVVAHCLPHVRAAVDHITESNLRAICRHAAAAYPQECCGTLINGILRRSANACGEKGIDPHHAFELDAVAAIEIAEVSRQADASLIAYHSHPDGSAAFSPADAYAAAPNGKPSYPQLCHLVIACTASGVIDARLYAWNKDEFTEFARWSTTESRLIIAPPPAGSP